MFITITGKLGSGKSTLCGLMLQKHGFEIYSTGTIQRKLARDLGVSTLELNELMRLDTKYDNIIDQEVVKLSQERRGDRLIFDSRLAWHFIPESFKVYLIIDPLAAARRVVANPRGKEELYKDVEEAKIQLLKRALVENIRFQEVYGINNLDYTNYNLILDTTWLSPTLIMEIIYDRYQHYNLHGCQTAVVMSPKSLYPTKPIPDTAQLIPTDNYLTNPIKIIHHDNYNYVTCGHKKLAVALKNNIPYVFTEILGDHKYSTTIDMEAPENFSAYELAGNFTYYSYPTKNTNTDD